MNNINIISSSSAGNCYIYFDDLMVDIGVPFSKVKSYIQNIKFILLSHQHSDHLNIKTLQKAIYENPKIKICCGWFLVDKLVQSNIPKKNIFVLELDKAYIISDYVITPVMAIHDVPNFGYKIHNTKTGFKIFHISDTSEIDHVQAIGYNLYCVEGNYETDDDLKEIIKKEKDEYGFSYRERVLKTHLSQLQALNWLDKNNTNGGNYIFIHQHKGKEDKNERN
jgi:Cft2 family RNA processing exonuclease